MEDQTEKIEEKKPLQIICLLCDRIITLPEYQEHVLMHQRAEMLADILALSRR